MTELPPNPFMESALERAIAADSVAGPDFADHPVPATDNFVLDEERFLADITGIPSNATA